MANTSRLIYCTNYAFVLISQQINHTKRVIISAHFESKLNEINVTLFIVSYIKIYNVSFYLIPFCLSFLFLLQVLFTISFMHEESFISKYLIIFYNESHELKWNSYKSGIATTYSFLFIPSYENKFCHRKFLLMTSNL